MCKTYTYLACFGPRIKDTRVFTVVWARTGELRPRIVEALRQDVVAVAAGGGLRQSHTLVLTTDGAITITALGSLAFRAQLTSEYTPYPARSDSFYRQITIWGDRFISDKGRAARISQSRVFCRHRSSLMSFVFKR